MYITALTKDPSNFSSWNDWFAVNIFNFALKQVKRDSIYTQISMVW